MKNVSIIPAISVKYYVYSVVSNVGDIDNLTTIIGYRSFSVTICTGVSPMISLLFDLIEDIMNH